MVSIQSSYISPSKCRFFHFFGNLVSCSFLTSCLYSFSSFSCGDVIYWCAPKSRGETHLKVPQSQVAESWDLEARSRLPTLERGRGSNWEPRIRLGRGTSRSSLNLHQNKPPTWLVHNPGHPWVLGQAMGNWTHSTHHGPDSGVSHHLTPYSILCDTPRHPRPNVTFSRDSRVGVLKFVPKLSRVESRDFGSS